MLTRRVIRGLVLVAACLAAGAMAQADRAVWHQATTAHFIVYAKDRESKVETLAAELEVFDSVMRRWHGASDDKALLANKVTVFVVPNLSEVRRLCGCGDFVYGFYKPTPGGGVAVIPRDVPIEGRSDMSAQIVLYHEYGHHFLLGNFAAAYPPWFSEGYAEFVGTAQITEDAVVLGAAAQHRADSIFASRPVPTRFLFSQFEESRGLEGNELEAIYGRGWLLTHYIMFNPERMKQFRAYMADVGRGTPSLRAATAAFGDLQALDRDISTYARNRKFTSIKFLRSGLPVPTVSLHQLTAGQDALMTMRMESVLGVKRLARSVFGRARSAAKNYPNDPIVQGWLAKMAFDAGDWDAAEAAADLALAANPRFSQALLYKGRAQVGRAAASKAAPPVFTAARQFIVRANRLDPDWAPPLLAYYDSFAAQGRPATTAAITGLYRAHELVPQDEHLRVVAAGQHIRDGQLDDARQLLAPLAYGAHKAPNNSTAKLIAAIAAAKDREAAIAAYDAYRAAEDRKDTDKNPIRRAPSPD